MKDKLKSFLRKKLQDFSESVAGKAGYLDPRNIRIGNIYFPTGSMAPKEQGGYQGIATLLFLAGRQEYKPHILNWVLGEGLMQASIGRETLLKEVQKQLNTSVVKKQSQSIGVQKQAMMKVEMARDVSSIVGKDYGDKQITSHDLFSPEARKRDPRLNFIKINGLNIDQYYEKNYEPKWMTILSNFSKTGENITFDLEEMRKIANKMGLQPFKYGGINGYIQYVEKGDWQEDIHKGRDISNQNQQWGFDVRPEMQKGKIVADVQSVDSKGKPIYHFMGGHFTQDINRIEKTLRDMTADFPDFAQNIENNLTAGIDPKIFERWKKIIEIKDYVEKIDGDSIKKHLLKKTEGGKPIGSATRHFRLGDMGASNWSVVPRGINANDLEYIVDKGLRQPITLKGSQVNIREIEKSLPLWYEDESPPTNGWYRIITKDKINFLQFKLNEEIIKEIKDFIFRNPKSSENQIRTRWYYTEIPSMKKWMALNDSGRNDSRMNLGAIFNEAFKNNEELKEILTKVEPIIYAVKGVDPSQYTFNLGKKAIKLEVDERNTEKDMGDPILSSLLLNGFNWEMTPKKLRDRSINPNKPQHPFDSFETGVSAVLKKGNYRYIVIKDEEGWKLLVPDEGRRVETARIPRSQKELYPVIGMRNKKVSGGTGGLHIPANPAGPEYTKFLIEKLLQGKRGGLGEFDAQQGDREYSNPQELPSVLGGVSYAKRNFNEQKFNRKDWIIKNAQSLGGNYDGRNISSIFADVDLRNWALEALPLYMNDRAWQIGWISQDELKYLKSQSNNVKKAGLSSQGKEIDEEREKAKETKNRNFWGIVDILKKNEILDLDYQPDEDQKNKDDIYNQFLQLIEKFQKEHSPIIEKNGKKEMYTLLDVMRNNGFGDVAEAYAVNGFLWRKRRIGQYVLKKMNEELNKLKGLKQVSSGSGEEQGSGYEQHSSKGDDPDLSREDEIKRLSRKYIPLAGGIDPKSFRDLGPSQLVGDVEEKLGREIQTIDPKSPSLKKTIEKKEKQLDPETIEMLKLAGVDVSNLIPAARPATPAARPATPAARPATPAARPATPAARPATPAARPATPAARPATPAARPATPAARPATPAARPATPAARPATPAARPATSAWSDEDEELLRLALNPLDTNESFLSYSDWKKNENGMIGTFVVSPKKPRNGDGFNIWGAAGKSAVSIAGEADTAEIDPTGKKGSKRAGRR